jgi:hypothetical protein
MSREEEKDRRRVELRERFHRMEEAERRSLPKTVTVGGSILAVLSVILYFVMSQIHAKQREDAKAQLEHLKVEWHVPSPEWGAVATDLLPDPQKDLHLSDLEQAFERVGYRSTARWQVTITGMIHNRGKSEYADVVFFSHLRHLNGSTSVASHDLTHFAGFQGSSSKKFRLTVDLTSAEAIDTGAIVIQLRASPSLGEQKR